MLQGIEPQLDSLEHAGNLRFDGVVKQFLALAQENRMKAPSKILVASSELHNRRALVAILNEEGWSTISVSRVRDCRELLATQDINLIFCDPLLTDGNYRDLLTAGRSLELEIPLVVTSRLADWDEYLQAVHHGAFDLIPSPCPRADVLRLISQRRRETSSPIFPTERKAVAAHPAAV
jgi:DNA-binding NtrC family response regulator